VHSRNPGIVVLSPQMKNVANSSQKSRDRIPAASTRSVVTNGFLRAGDIAPGAAAESP
jgi:hypothetical protein